MATLWMHRPYISHEAYNFRIIVLSSSFIKFIAFWSNQSDAFDPWSGSFQIISGWRNEQEKKIHHKYTSMYQFVMHSNNIIPQYRFERLKCSRHFYFSETDWTTFSNWMFPNLSKSRNHLPTTIIDSNWNQSQKLIQNMTMKYFVLCKLRDKFCKLCANKCNRSNQKWSAKQTKSHI